MTQEQEKLFKKKVWDYHITENTTEYEIAKHFYQLGLAQKENNMDYEKAYKEARERALKLRVQNPFDTVSQMMEYVFPELKESKEEWIEKIRTEIISYLKNRQILSIPEHDAVATWLSWTEKESKQKPIIEGILTATNYDKIFQNCNVHKFNVGDWIIFNENHDSLYQVEEIQGLRYYLRHYMGGSMSVHIDNQLIRLWTIEDAKDGDILSAHECIVVFKEIDGLNIKCHCTYHYMNNPSFHVDTLQNKTAFHPATKAQRELLFDEMYEAGYEWDAAKKELRKIEQQPSQWNILDYRTWQYIVSDVLTKYNGIGQYLDDGFCKKIAKYMQENWSKKLSLGQTSAWTDEDEELCQDALDAFEALANDLNPSEDWGKLYDWLKSLKQRLQ